MSESSPSIHRALLRAARYSATVSACRVTRRTRAFSFALWPRAAISAASRRRPAIRLFFLMQPGKDMILVETVGVGQGEIEIVRLADCTLVVLVPGMGDDVQSLKAGLMEIADIFVLNKSDREGADRFEQQLLAILQLVPERDGWKPPVVRTVATEGKGVSELARQIALFHEHMDKAHRPPGAGTRVLERVAAAAGRDAPRRAGAGRSSERRAVRQNRSAKWQLEKRIHIRP